MPWTIEFFKTERGSIPVMDSMRTLPKRVGTRLANDIDLLEEYGLQLDNRYIKKLKGTGARVDLWELRTRSGNLRVRTFFGVLANSRIVLLHSFAKKTRSISRREIETAMNRLIEYRKAFGSADEFDSDVERGQAGTPEGP